MSNYETQENNATYVGNDEIAKFTSLLSGKTPDGESKVTISYQSYAMEDDEGSIDRERIYTTTKPYIELSIDKQYPQFYVMDIIYRSYDDPELKMLWGRMQRFRHNLANNPEKTWIFYFNILEKASISSRTDIEDTLLVANVLNPTIFFLTREIPDILSTDDMGDDGKLHGGNAIRMLIPVELVSFQVTDQIDTVSMKGEIMRENSERDFLNNTTWTE